MFLLKIPEIIQKKFPELLLSVIGIAVAFYWAYKNYKEEKKNKKHFYWDFFTSQYLDACFKLYNQNIELKEGRQKLKLEYNDLKGDKYDKFTKEVIKEDPPIYENKLAHRMSVVLNRIGQAAFTGDLPLDNIFPISSKMILKDWQTSKTLIEKISGTDSSAIAYTRKFFRWLACASCMYIIAYHVVKWEDVEDNIKQYVMNGDNFEDYKDGKKIISDIKSLQESDKKILDRSTKYYVWRLKKKFTKKMKKLLSEQL